MNLLRITIYLSLVAGFIFGNQARSQCVQEVNFQDWVETGDYAGSWAIQSSNTELLTQVNTNYPTMFVGPDTLINVRVTGTFRVEDNADDDYVGFVFGFQQTNGVTWGPNAASTMYHDYYLFDWKKQNQNYIGYNSSEGFSLNDVDGTFSYNFGSVFPSFWTHTNSVPFTVLQTDFSTTNGWVAYQYYDFELLYTPTRAVILIDSDTIFDQPGCFEPGLFGFYNYSQTGARYLNFNYELFIDYQIESQNVCLGDTAKFNFIDTSGCAGANAFSNLTSFYWDLGDGTLSNDTNPRHVYQTADTFLVSLIATDINGCTDTSQKEIYIHAPPSAAIYADPACLGDSMQLIDTTIMNMGFITSWDWEMGDGNGNDTVENPWYTYQSAGNFTTELVVVTNAGCSDTAYYSVEVLPNPISDFDISNVCDGDTVYMTENTTEATEVISDFFWDVENDGFNDYTGAFASHDYGTHGTYTVELKIVDLAGCRDSTTKTVKVNPTPVTDFAGPGVCFLNTTQFLDNSSIPLGGIASWQWSYGDSTGAQFTTSNAPQPGPSHLYDNPGTKTVQLILTSDSGCVDSLEKDISVYYLPVANFITDTVCNDSITTFQQTSIPHSGFLAAYDWQFGDGNSANNFGVQHDYIDPGTYLVTLGVTTNFGCEDTVQKSVRVYPNPNTAFGWNNKVCLGEVLPFEDQSSIAQVTPGGDEIVAWKWQFNDSIIENVTSVIYETDQFEEINVSLTTWSNYGCKTKSSNVASVYPLPKAAFKVEEACVNDTSWFTNKSTVAEGLIESATWDFDNSSTSNELHPGEVFKASREYDVTMVVTTNRGCKDQITNKVNIPESPVVDFDVSPRQGCSPLLVSTTNKSTISSGTLRYDWYLDDSLVSENPEPFISVKNDTIVTTKHKISLVATSEIGCSTEHTWRNAVAVLPTPNAGFHKGTDNINPFEPYVNFINTSEYGVRWAWDFGDGDTISDFAPGHYYEASGDYTVTQITWNEYNCSDTIEHLVHLEPITTLYIPNSFTPNGDGVNDTWFVQGFNENRPFEIEIHNRWGFKMISGNNMQFEWDGIMPNSNKFAPVGTYVYMITYETSDNREEVVRGTFNLIR